MVLLHDITSIKMDSVILNTNKQSKRQQFHPSCFHIQSSLSEPTSITLFQYVPMPSHHTRSNIPKRVRSRRPLPHEWNATISNCQNLHDCHIGLQSHRSHKLSRTHTHSNTYTKCSLLGCNGKILICCTSPNQFPVNDLIDDEVVFLIHITISDCSELEVQPTKWVSTANIPTE